MTQTSLTDFGALTPRNVVLLAVAFSLAQTSLNSATNFSTVFSTAISSLASSNPTGLSNLLRCLNIPSATVTVPQATTALAQVSHAHLVFLHDA